ncbi:S1 family peptidase [Paenibacillus tyrfis]|uniref:S1 family peptidase n=1 Tax=Paenibacillus tyrfis TaxID=1501230 RepID=UPI000A534CC8|nr:serine protease [Paenibacillus tyrfis]
MRKISRSLLVFLGGICLVLSSFSISGADPPKVYDAESIYAFAQNATFYIRVFRADGTLKDTGTGFVVKQDGTALTAAHVVHEGERIACVLHDGTVDESCRVVSQDETTDSAVLQLSPSGIGGPKETYEYLNLRAGGVKHGEKVFAIGYPMKETKIITEGIVNSPKAQINGRDRILVSAQIVNGMSGGPILDKTGDVVGIISGSLRTMNNIHLVVNTEDMNSILQVNATK